MSLIYYIALADILILLVLIRFIFGSFKVFTKGIIGHLFSDVSEDIETFKKWEKEHDIAHKINLLYAAILGTVGISFLIYTQI